MKQLKVRFLIVFILGAMLISTHLFGFIAKGVKAPCPFCGHPCEYTKWISGSGGYWEECQPPFYHLSEAPFLFHCNQCGYTMYADHHEAVFPEKNDSHQDDWDLHLYFKTNPRKIIQGVLKDPHVRTGLNSKIETPLHVQYEIIEQIYTALDHNKILLNFSWGQFYATMTYFEFRANRPKQTSSAAQKALIYFKKNGQTSGDGDRIKLLNLCALFYLSGQRGAALRSYQKLLNTNPLWRLNEEGSEKFQSRFIANNILKDMQCIISRNDSSIWTKLANVGIMAQSLLQVNFPNILILFSVWLLALIFMWLFRKWAVLGALALFVAITSFLIFFQPLDSYLSFVFITLFWTGLLILTESRMRKNVHFAQQIQTPAWKFQRLTVILSPLAVGLFRLYDTFNWIPILIPWSPFPDDTHFGFVPMGIRRELGGRMLVHTLLFFMALLIWQGYIKFISRWESWGNPIFQFWKRWFRYGIIASGTIILVLVAALFSFIPFLIKWNCPYSAYGDRSYFTNMLEHDFEVAAKFLQYVPIYLAAVLALLVLIGFMGRHHKKILFKSKSVEVSVQIAFFLGKTFLIVVFALGTFQYMFISLYGAELMIRFNFPVISLYNSNLSPFFYLELGLFIIVILIILKTQVQKRFSNIQT